MKFQVWDFSAAENRYEQGYPVRIVESDPTPPAMDPSGTELV